MGNFPYPDLKKKVRVQTPIKKHCFVLWEASGRQWLEQKVDLKVPEKGQSEGDVNDDDTVPIKLG